MHLMYAKDVLVLDDVGSLEIQLVVLGELEDLQDGPTNHANHEALLGLGDGAHSRPQEVIIDLLNVYIVNYTP